MPTRFTVTGEVIDSGVVIAVGRPKLLDDRKDGHSQICSGRRRPALVFHNPHHGLLVGQPQHGTHEIIAVGTVDPRGAYHGGARTGLEHRCFARKFRRAINILRRRNVVFAIRRPFASVENVVGRDLDERDATSCCPGGKQHRSIAINRKRAFRLRLGAIHRRIGRCIDDCRRFDRIHHAIDPLSVFKIQFGPADRYHRHVVQDG